MTSLSRPVIDYGELIKPDRVHGRLYYDPAIFEGELEKIWYREWVYVGHESEIPQSGDYRTRPIGLQPVIMSRDEDGGVHLLMNRCAHRGNTVCQMERGNSHAFRCAYHGWTFANDGHLLGVTYASAYGPDFNRAEYGLTKVPRMAVYRGFIFGSMSPTGISLDEHLGQARKLIDDFADMSPTGEIELRAGVLKHRYEGNWKMAVENIVDAYHPPFVHQSGFSLGGRAAVNLTAIYGDKSIALTRDLGGGHAEIDSTVDFSGDRQWQRTTFSDPVAEEAQRSYVQAVEQRVGRERMQYLLGAAGPRTSLIFPNLQFLVNQVRVVQPVSVDASFVYYYPAMLKGAPEPINLSRLRQIEGAHGPAGFVAPDDIDVYERNQEGFQSRDNEWLILRRGIHREKSDDNGLVTGEASDELTQRAIWRRYKDLMTRP